jgi:hypothetical protein
MSVAMIDNIGGGVKEPSEIELNYSISCPQSASFNLPNLTTNFDSCISQMDMGAGGNGQIRNFSMNNNTFNVDYNYSNSGSMSIPTLVKIKPIEKGLSEREITYPFSVPGSYTIPSGFDNLYGIKNITFSKSTAAWTTFSRVRIDGNNLVLDCNHPFSSSENVTAYITFVGK